MKKLKDFSNFQIISEYELRFKSITERIGTSKISTESLRKILLNADNSKEHFAIMFLDGQNKLIETKIIFTGTLTTTVVYPREVIKEILSLNSANMILGHNHPSGEIIPSASDRALTKKLQVACDSIDVEILDHIIVGKEKYFSFADERLL